MTLPQETLFLCSFQSVTVLGVLSVFGQLIGEPGSYGIWICDTSYEKVNCLIARQNRNLLLKKVVLILLRFYSIHIISIDSKTSKGITRIGIFLIFLFIFVAVLIWNSLYLVILLFASSWMEEKPSYEDLSIAIAYVKKLFLKSPSQWIRITMNNKTAQFEFSSHEKYNLLFRGWQIAS